HLRTGCPAGSRPAAGPDRESHRRTDRRKPRPRFDRAQPSQERSGHRPDAAGIPHSRIPDAEYWPRGDPLDAPRGRLGVQLRSPDERRRSIYPADKTEARSAKRRGIHQDGQRGGLQLQGLPLRFVDNLTFRLTVLNAAAACLAVIVALSLAYYLTVVVPMNSVKDQLRREVAALAAVHEAGGPSRLSEVLWDRRQREAARYPFDTLVDARGMPSTGNLPSWPETRTPEWLHIEADLHLEGQEEDRDALVLDHRFADGTRL